MFIAFDGADGCGKTTQAKLLAAKLSDNGFDVFLVQDPGTTEQGKRIREILLDKSLPISPWAQALLFTAARAETAAKILEHCRRGGVAVADRWIGSTYVYQGLTLGVDLRLIDQLVSPAFLCGLTPHVTIVLDVEVRTAAMRRAKRCDIGGCNSPQAAAAAKAVMDRFEAEGEEFRRKLREGYHKFVEEFSGVKLLEVEGYSEAVTHDMIVEVLVERLPSLKSLLESAA